MRKEKVVHFVCFDTILGREPFLAQWEQYTRSVNSDQDVTMQQSEKNGGFRYIAQHRCTAGELQFLFTKNRRSSRTPEVEIKLKQAGGYSFLQEEKLNNIQPDEKKIFAFISDPRTDLGIFKQLTEHSKLNIYEAYYENCQYAYILEYFVKKKNAAELLDQLKLHNAEDIGLFQECKLHAIAKV
ncbi:MAG: hypothetical protein H0V30_11095 [Chitinophagaceae bacterium]|jgi:hypothetical protein|nr:hypothetical protein [Chitinophagaceae bacterium]